VDNFIEQAAKDYDMTIDEVLHVQKCCAPDDDFYEMLELYILNRNDQ
jgi:hypothetical protein